MQLLDHGLPPYEGPPTICWVCARIPDPDRNARGCDRSCLDQPTPEE